MKNLNAIQRGLAWLVVMGVAIGWSVDAGAQASRERARALLDETFGDRARPVASVLLLGTFHFVDPGLDDFKPQHEVDVLSDERQAEIAAIVDALARFQPTRIGVERRPAAQAELDQQYAAYAAGNWDLPANEIYQIGFRLANAAQLDGVQAVDAEGRWLEPRVDPTAFAREHGLTAMLRSPYVLVFDTLNRRMDALKMEHTLSEHLLLMNDPALLRAQHGVYLQRRLAVGTGTEYPGVDGFVSQWYNRNLRIFANIQRLCEGDDERVVVIIGAGHVPILRHLVESAPGFTLVEVGAYLEEP